MLGKLIKQSETGKCLGNRSSGARIKCDFVFMYWGETNRIVYAIFGFYINFNV